MEQNNYQDALIYTIKTDNGLYVGSTIDFVDRKKNHKVDCFNESRTGYNRKVYKNIRENGGDYTIEIYKMFPCNSDKELRIEEESVRKYLNANLNMQKCFTSEEEVREQKSEYAKTDKNKISKKVWYENNKETICEKMSKKITCECGCPTTQGTLNRHRKSNKHNKLMNNLVKV